jgi:quaternary ammonium compound-resistance protein SugE
MAWVYLVLAGILEVGWAIGLKYTVGWTKLYPSIFTFITLVLSFIFLSIAVKTLPVGTAYAVWTGIGAVGTAALGIFLFNEPGDWSRVGCIFLIVAGIIGLKLTSSH